VKPGADADLEAMAADELVRACTLSWRALSRVLPWGDTYDGYAPSGRAVMVERTYVWANGEGGDILAEVVVAPSTVLYDRGARVSTIIPAPRRGTGGD